MSETQLVRAVLDALAAKKVWAWRVNSGAMVIKSAQYGNRFLAGAPKGSPDIFGIVPGGHGQLFGLECKSPTGKQNDNQRRWQLKAEAHGVRYGIVRSVSNALNLLADWSPR